jgi:hypothetical protein
MATMASLSYGLSLSHGVVVTVRGELSRGVDHCASEVSPPQACSLLRRVDDHLLSKETHEGYRHNMPVVQHSQKMSSIMARVINILLAKENAPLLGGRDKAKTKVIRERPLNYRLLVVYYCVS